MSYILRFFLAVWALFAPIYLLLLWVNVEFLDSNEVFSILTLVGLLTLALSAFRGLEKFQTRIGEEGVAAEMKSPTRAIYFVFKSALWPLFLKG